MSNDPILGELVSAGDVNLICYEDLPGLDIDQDDKNKKNVVTAYTGDALFAYREENKINGIIVNDADRDLPVERDDQLQQAFRLHQIPHSEILRLPADNEKYNQLLHDK